MPIRRLRRKIKRLIVKLIRLNHTPPQVALGVAIGVFIGIMPLYGFHTLMVIIAAFLVRRANIIAILIGTNISLPPTLPIITWAGYNIGRLILWNKYPPLEWGMLKNFHYQDILKFYWPLFLGSFFLALICAAVFYFLTLWFMRRRQRRRKKA